MDNIGVWAVIGAGLFMIIISIIIQLQSEVARINVTLNKIALQVGVPDTVTDDVRAELKDLILKGRKIEAIKRYRTVTGLGLKESKDYIDSLSEQE